METRQAKLRRRQESRLKRRCIIDHTTAAAWEYTALLRTLCWEYYVLRTLCFELNILLLISSAEYILLFVEYIYYSFQCWFLILFDENIMFWAEYTAANFQCWIYTTAAGWELNWRVGSRAGSSRLASLYRADAIPITHHAIQPSRSWFECDPYR